MVDILDDGPVVLCPKCGKSQPPHVIDDTIDDDIDTIAVSRVRCEACNEEWDAEWPS